MIEHSIFSIMAELILEIIFMLYPLHNGLTMNEYKAYWLTGFPLINSWEHAKKKW